MYYDMFSSMGRGDLAEVESLLDQGVDPNWSNSPFNKIPLLHHPLDCSRLDADRVAITKMLLEAGANPNAVRGASGDSALILLGRCKKW